MARHGVTYSEVASAAQQLLASGKSLTIEKIRGILGTGSNSTLGDLLRKFKQNYGQNLEIISKEKLPEQLVAAMKGLWDLVVDQADEKINQIKVETEKKLLALIKSNEELQVEGNLLQQNYQKNKNAYELLLSDKKTIEELYSLNKIEIATLTEKCLAYQKHEEEQKIRIQELNKQNQQIQINLEHYREAALEQRLLDQKRHEEEKYLLDQSLKKINYELNELKIKYDEKEKDFEKIKIKYEGIQEDYAMLEIQCHEIQSKYDHGLTTITQLTEGRQYWEEHAKIMQNKYDLEHQSYCELQTEKALLTKDLSLVKKQWEDLCEHNKILAHDKWILGQEKAQLQGQLLQILPNKPKDKV